MNYPCPYNWYRLPYIKTNIGYKHIDCIKGNYALFDTSDPLFTGESGYWMSTGWKEISELLSQVDAAYGRVLCTGLGMGIVPLLAAFNDKVSEVVVLEKDIEIIEIFKFQGFDTSKLTILNQDVYSYTSTSSFDTIIIDHYNVNTGSLYEFILDNVSLLKYNTNSPNAVCVAYRWEELLNIHGLSFIKIKNALSMPTWTSAQVNRYLHSFTNCQYRIPEISSALAQIHLNRNNVTAFN